MYSSRPRLVPARLARARWRRSRGSPAAPFAPRAASPGHLGRGRPRGPLERLEDRLLGDPVATLEVGRVGVERGDGRQRVGQVVEDEDEVGLDEGRRRDADRVALGERDGRLEGRDRVVGERPDGAAGEARHALGRLDAAARDEGADGRQRVGDVDASRSAGPGRRRAPSPAGSGSGRGRRGPRAGGAARRRGTSSDRGARRPRPIRAGRRGSPSSSRRKAPIGVSRSAGRVARRRIVSALAARRCACARLIGSAVVIAVGLGESRTTFVSGTKGRAFRGATLIRRCRTLVTDGPVRRLHGRRSALPSIAGALRRSLLASAARAASRSVRRLPGPFPVVVAPARTSRRISGSTCDGYSSRSQPAVRDVRGVWAGRVRGVKRRRDRPAQRPAERPVRAVRRHRSVGGRPAARRAWAPRRVEHGHVADRRSMRVRWTIRRKSHGTPDRACRFVPAWSIPQAGPDWSGTAGSKPVHRSIGSAG